MTADLTLNTRAEVAMITASLKDRIDPAYEAGMRRTVPSAQKAHAVRVPEIRRAAVEWSREHKGIPFESTLAVAEALWATEWREERIVAIAILARRKEAPAVVDWQLLDRRSAGIDTWELVDNLASMLSGPDLGRTPASYRDSRVLRPTRWSGVAVWPSSPSSRPPATTSLAARKLRAMAAALKGDRGPTMRKAVEWARRAGRQGGAGSGR
jgi:3-methyladenine DNA glycosylase AlkD